MAEKKDEQPILIKKIKKGGHGHHGGAWKLAYADFVTALMAFFLVMWIVGMDFKTKHGIADYFNNPGVFPFSFQSSPNLLNLDGKPPAQNDKIDAAGRTLVNIDIDAAESLAALIRTAIRNEPKVGVLERKIEVKVESDGLRITFSEAAGGVFFEPGTANLKGEAKRAFQAVATVLIGAKKQVEVEGHTDRAPLKDLNYTQWEMGADRANAVRRALYAVGMPQDQVVAVTSRADRRLKRQDDPKAPENNRIVLFVPLATDQ